MSNNPNKIQRLQLENFTCFERADMEFSEGINVFIGENGTGKTHLLKVMYAAIIASPLPQPGYVTLGYKELREYFANINIDNLIRLERNYAKIHVDLVDDKEFIFEFGHRSYSDFFQIDNDKIQHKGLFFPPQEMLSWQRGFQSLYAKREVSFDRTYYDLAVALGLGKLKNSALEKAEKLAREIREAIKAEVIQRDERFYFKFDDLDAELEAPIVAQGINKLGQLYYLILNGSLTKDTILFWDEPETGLNPKYIKIVAQFLQTLAKAGVQIFLATHDYLLVHQLSLAAEYREVTEAPDMKFFSLYKGENGTEIESGETVTAIQHNPILDEYAALHNEQLRLYSELLQKVEE